MLPLIATIAVGPDLDYQRITIPRMKTYADRVGADFWVIDDAEASRLGPVIEADSGQPGGPTYLKIPLIEWLGKQQTYSSMLYLDADVFIKRSAGNIFENFNHMASLMMAPDMNSQRELPLWKEWAAKHYGLGAPFLHDGKPETYFNAGVFMMRPAAAYHMSRMRGEFPDIHSRWGDQDYLNCWAKFMDGPHLGILGETWNIPFPFMTTDPNAGHFLHLCGLANQDKLPWLEKLNELDV